MELTNDELKDLIQELHNRIEFLENKTLNSDDRNNKPDNYTSSKFLEDESGRTDDDEWVMRERALGW